MGHLSKILLLLVFIDYTVTMVQLLMAKILPIEVYKNVPIYSRWIPDLGFVFTIEEPYDIHYNPVHCGSIVSARRVIDANERAEAFSKQNLLLKVAHRMKII